MGNYFPPLSYRLPICRRSSSKHSRISSVPHLLPHFQVTPTWKSSTPATCHPTPVIPAPRTACLSLLPLPVPVRSHLWFLSLHPGPCQSLGSYPVMGLSAPICPYLALPKLSSKSWPRPVLGFLLGEFLREGERPGRLHSLEFARLGPHSPRYLSIPAPFRLPLTPH